jgi:hypothetical protein
MICYNKFNGQYHIIIASMIAFFLLNFMENLIHFSIGRNVENKNDANINLKMPEKYDIIKILVIMIVFTILQGLFTYLFDLLIE